MTIRFLGPLLAAAAIFSASGLAQVAPTTNMEAATVTPARHQHGPAQIRGRRPDNSVESTNWSGYAVTGSDFTDVKGSWIVPAVNCSVTPGTKSTAAYSSFWVGIDGYTSNTVEQTGTDSDCDYSSGGSVASYYAWYEFYPAASYEIALTVMPGDIISAEVSYSGSEFTVTIKDVTTGKSFSKTANVRKAKRTSAEWIAEAPCCTRGGGILPLADFNGTGKTPEPVAFGSHSYPNEATDGSAAEPISYYGTGSGAGACTDTDSTDCVAQINMVSSSGVTEDTTSSLSTDLTGSFTVYWDAE